MTVLIVDNDFAAMKELRRMAKEQGHRAVVATDHAGAERAVKKYQPDVIVFDSTHDKKGIRGVLRLRTLTWCAHLIYATHHRGEAIINRALKAGADSFLGKEEIHLFAKMLSIITERRYGQAQ